MIRLDHHLAIPFEYAVKLLNLFDLLARSSYTDRDLRPALVMTGEEPSRPHIPDRHPPTSCARPGPNPER
jgi:hypothetical protein